MSWRFVSYDDDGTEKWAIWSTVVDDWICYDMTEAELIKFYVEEEAKQARKDAKERITDARSGDRAYHDTHPPTDEIERLKRTTGDER